MDIVIPYKKQALRAAKDLKYDQYVIDRIKSTNKESEIARIMLTARQKGFEK